MQRGRCVDRTDVPLITSDTSLSAKGMTPADAQNARERGPGAHAHICGSKQGQIASIRINLGSCVVGCAVAHRRGKTVDYDAHRPSLKFDPNSLFPARRDSVSQHPRLRVSANHPTQNTLTR